MSFTKRTIVTITAPTCAGKSFLIESLCKNLGFSRVISSTSRQKRAGEVQGVDYYFIDEREFEDKNNFVETNAFGGAMYGVSVQELQRINAEGGTPVMILDPNGVKNIESVRASMNADIFKIFVHTSEEVKLQRLHARARAQIAVTPIHDIFEVLEDGRRREQSMKTVERLWMTQNVWDVIVPGDNIDEALDLVQRGVRYRNTRVAEPKPYTHEQEA